MEELSLPAPEPARRSRRFPAALIVAGLALMATLGFLAIRDNEKAAALPPGAIELVATQEGVIASVGVTEGQSIGEGDLLITFEDQAEQAELTAAHQALQDLAGEVRASDVAVAITPPEGVTGRIVQIGPLRPDSVPRVDPLPAPTEGPNPTLPAVGPPTSQPNPKRELEEALAATEKELSEAQAFLLNAQHQLEQARSEAIDAQKGADVGKVLAQQRRQQADKMKMLLSEGAASQVEAARAEALYANTQGAYLVGQEMADAAAKKVKDLEAALERTAKSIPILEKTLEIQRIALKNAPEPKPNAITEPGAPLREIETRPVRKPAVVQPAPLPSVPTKVDVDKGAIREGDQLLASAKQRVDLAEAAIVARRIHAPRKGKVLKLLVKPGDRVKIGQVIAVLL